MSFRDLGFRRDPFDTMPLEASASGKALLVDREREIKRLKNNLYETSLAPTLEGANGIGKTSLINVALYEISTEHKEASGPAFILCPFRFQVTPETKVDDFLDDMYREVAIALISQKQSAPIPPGYTRENISDLLEDFISNPMIKSLSVGIAQLGGGGVTNAPNTSQAFERNGFRSLVRGYLRKIFRDSEAGAVICVLDNLEILGTSENAKRVFETLRDSIFNIPGIRWVCSGAQGVIRGLWRSGRMNGYFCKPILVGEIQQENAHFLYEKRVDAYKVNDNASLPITISQFQSLFDIFRGNTRFTLTDASVFCNWCFEQYDAIDEIPDDAFDRWLGDELNNMYGDVYPYLSKSEKAFFEKALQWELIVSSEFLDFGLSSERELIEAAEKFVRLDLLYLNKEDKGTSSSEVYEISPAAYKFQYFIDSQHSEGEEAL